jgi:hypothetical protein
MWSIWSLLVVVVEIMEAVVRAGCLRDFLV